ncbi:mdm2-binding protein-like [Xenia sp. Carnegie-2017]|uniref:mdm2-binding protein-like n=1 Tax=Xenia sp. Carnegie-2017 TaxID=2897299 RepID=UPI001F04EB4C|nr:mdm2-binding protein-like [Xenia sp. Carnegie-2017]
MLKYFNKDGKPKISNFNDLTTINKERNSSKGKDTDDEKEKVISGVDYCTDSNKSTRIQVSPQLLLKHETLSICNTPNRLAKAKLQDVKRNKNKDVSDDSKNPLNKLSKKEETIEAKSKRRSFDGLEIKKDADRREKRSERHKRRLARVVKHALVKYGVKPTDDNFTTCSERLYYVCKSFLQDLKSSERLNEEMKKLAESHVSTVVEFEKRQKEDKS